MMGLLPLEILTMSETPAMTDDSQPLPLFVTPSRPRVLLAEDDPAARDLIAENLRDAGYEVVECVSGEALWSRVKELVLEESVEAPPDLIISDLRMPPGPSGLEVLALIRQTDWGTPFVLMTAFGDLLVHHEAARLGATRVLNKPFQPSELIAVATDLVNPGEM